MNIPKPLKVVLLLLTFWLPLYMIAFMFMVGSMMVIDFDLLWALHNGTMAVTLLLMLVYVIHLFRTPRIDSGKKALWGITLFCAAPFAMPFYFFAHIWPDPAPAWPEIVPPPAA